MIVGELKRPTYLISMMDGEVLGMMKRCRMYVLCYTYCVCMCAFASRALYGCPLSFSIFMYCIWKINKTNQ